MANKTEIFASFDDFLDRADKKTNGVSPEFAKKHPDYARDNETNTGCWNCEACKSCVWCKSCHSCVSCMSCVSCRSLRYELKNQSELNVPLVQNIHQSVFNAASAENALDMNDWHVCETTHCRAGWVVHLAGKAGYELEKLTSTPFAAMAIYNKSSDIKVPLYMFYVDNDESLTDMKRCAKLELDFSRPT